MSSLDVSRAVAQSADPALERWLARAEQLHARGRDRPAILVLRRAAERAPADPRPLLLLGEIALPAEPDAPAAIEPDAHTRSLAEEIAERAGSLEVDGDPTDATYRRTASRVRALGPWAVALTGDHRSAIDRASLGAGRMDIVAARILRRLGALAIGRHDLIAADEALVAATRADPTDIDLLTDLATVRLARGRSDDAVRLLLDARRRRPDDVTIQRDLGGALLAAGRADEAVTIFDAIASERRTDARAHLDLARAALEAGEPERAAAAAREAAAHVSERDPEPFLVLAAASIASGDLRAAREAFRSVLRWNPNDVRATRGLSSLDSNSP